MKKHAKLFALTLTALFFTTAASAQIIDKSNEAKAKTVLADGLKICKKVEAMINYNQFSPKSVHFSFLDLEEGQSLRWDFGDGATSQEASPVHTYKHPGAFAITMTVYNRCGKAAEDRTVITIHPGASKESMR